MPNGPGVFLEEKIDELIDGCSLHIGLAFVGLNAALPQGKNRRPGLRFPTRLTEAVAICAPAFALQVPRFEQERQ